MKNRYRNHTVPTLCCTIDKYFYKTTRVGIVVPTVRAVHSRHMDQFFPHMLGRSRKNYVGDTLVMHLANKAQFSES